MELAPGQFSFNPPTAYTRDWFSNSCRLHGSNESDAFPVPVFCCISLLPVKPPTGLAFDGPVPQAKAEERQERVSLCLSPTDCRYDFKPEPSQFKCLSSATPSGAWNNVSNGSNTNSSNNNNDNADIISNNCDNLGRPLSKTVTTAQQMCLYCGFTEININQNTGNRQMKINNNNKIRISQFQNKFFFVFFKWHFLLK